MARVAESVVGALGLTPLTQLPRFCSPFHSPSRQGAKTSRETPTKTISHLVLCWNSWNALAAKLLGTTD